jgi:hypothetical protein
MLSITDPAKGTLSTTVTISYNDVVIATKSVTFTGEVASIRVTPTAIGKTSSVNNSTATVSFYDAAGNVIYPGGSSWPTSGLITDSSNPTNIVSALSLTTVPASGVIGTVGWTCGATAGSSQVDLEYVNPDATIIKSNVFTASCAGNAYTYSAAFDKSSYTPGEIATLTVTFKDFLGNLSNDNSNTIAQTGYVPVISSGGLTAVAATASTDVSSFGTKQYKLIVGNNTGTFTSSIDFPYVDSVNASQKATTATLVVATSDTSLNDVLKGIVTLIGAINSQVTSLQKAVTSKTSVKKKIAKKKK